MGSSRLEVNWSPYHLNKFFTWGNDISLYEVRSVRERAKQTDILVSENTSARLLATNTNYRYVKCIDVYPKSESDLLLAVGQANGKVSLTTFGPSVFDSIGLAGIELNPRHARQCSTVKWNPNEANLLASGYEKHRSDYSILIWDVLKSPADRAYGSYSSVLGLQNTESIRPIMEIGLSDIAHSIAWFNQSAHKLVVGVNNKNLKIMDIREITSAVYSQSTKAVFGVEVDPYDDNFIVSFGDNQIAVWDCRNMEKPLVMLTQSKIVSKVLWCPTRRNLIGSLQRESSAIHLHDLQQSVTDIEPSVLWRSIQPGQNIPLTSFSWHPRDENRLIAISYGGTITDYTVFERMTLNWSPSTHIVWTYGRQHLKLISDQDKVYTNVQDLTPKMKRRAVNEYGLKQELWKNGEVCESEPLALVWHWLHLSKSLVENGTINCSSNISHPGIRHVLGIDGQRGNGLKSEPVCAHWQDITMPVLTYKSPGRENALQLCGWRFHKDPAALERIELDGEYSRAAAIAIFNLKLRFAIDILNKGASRNPNLAVIAMALSGYTTDKKSLWREMCASTKEQLTDPYLKAAFSFLVDQSETYEHVLCEREMLMDDRIGFACTFLSDSDLIDYIKNLTETVYQSGDLTGMLLTGTTEECIPLLQKFLDNTGDVQTVSVIAVRTFPSSVIHDNAICQSWVEGYRSLLDGWRLWMQRAKFDIFMNADRIPPQQVFISCNFCGKSISAFMQDRLRNKSKMLGMQNSDATNFQGLRVLHDEITSCPHCNKPLPRCSICLANMGTQSTFLNMQNREAGDGPNPSVKAVEFSSWFTWCQTCRHGGHADHLLKWFQQHLECPVTSCTCHCLSLDDL